MARLHGADVQCRSKLDHSNGPCICSLPQLVNKECENYGKQHFYEISGDTKIPDPAEAIKNNLGDDTAIINWLSDTAFLSSFNLFNGDSREWQNANVVNGTSMSVDSVAASAASMKSVDGIRQKEVDGEALQIILLFVGALLMLLPGMGEKVGALFDSTMIVRMSALISNAGNLALTGYTLPKTRGLPHWRSMASWLAAWRREPLGRSRPLL